MENREKTLKKHVDVYRVFMHLSVVMKNNTITCEDLIHAGQDDEIADLFEIALDIIEKRGGINVEDVKPWLPSYTYYSGLKAALDPTLHDAVIKHALGQC